MGYEYEYIEKGSPDFPVGVFSTTIYYPFPHHHIEYEMFCLDEGDCVFSIAGKEYQMRKGDVVFVQPGLEHYARSVREGEEYHYNAFVFDASVIGGPDDQCRKTFERMKIKNFLVLPEYLLKKIHDVTSLKKDSMFGQQIMIKSVLFEIISYIIESKQFLEIVTLYEPKKAGSAHAVDSAILYIHEHFRENISLDDLLETTNYCKSHFIRLFKNATGLKFTDYVNHYRIEKSCLDLMYTNKNVTEIAIGNGFNNIQYFSKTFKEYMKCTPLQYKKNARNLIVPSSMADSH